MARYLAIDWDDVEARIVSAAKRGRRIALEAALRVPLPAAADAAGRAAEIGGAIRDALAAARIKPSGATVLVAVARSSVELRSFDVDAVADDDLPDAVRNQAQREMTSLAENSRLDFVSWHADDGESIHVAAAAISKPQFDQVMAVCRAADLKPSRLLLRTFSAASLLVSRFQPAERSVLLVDRLGSQADLTALVDERVVLARTVKVADGADNALVAEIHRTAASVPLQPHAAPIEVIYVGGSTGEELKLAETIEQQFAVPVRMFDPLEELDLSKRGDGALPDESGRFAPLVGAILDEADGSPHTLNFLEPRRPPKRHDRRRLQAAAVIAAVLLMLTAWGAARYKLSTVDQQIDELAAESRRLDALVKKAEEKRQAVAMIDDWAQREVMWLEELRNLSVRFPSARDAMLLRVSLTSAPAGGGVIELEGLVRDPSIVGRIESQLRDPRHEVRSKRVEANIQDEAYTWKFQSSLTVTPEDETEYIGRQVEPAPGGPQRRAAERSPQDQPVERSLER